MDSFQYKPPKNTPVTDEELLEDLKVVASKTGKLELSQRMYCENGGKYNPSTMFSHFGTWSSALAKAGLLPANICNFSDEELFENILNIWRHKGEQPVRSDLTSPPSAISQSPYNRRFKSWSEALRCFIEYAAQADKVLPTKQVTAGVEKRVGRDPSLRLRFQVLNRDHFACVQCGASPAKDPSVDLHVDHVIPWSKGGKTEISNLRTLCQKCNLGKSNLDLHE
ncbi:MAG: hypothetical protein A2X34_01905 [Elusimicrobia bacterium GWC2_51_8]|nr:MAG: hypothetical protein A2X33_05740 [Elusimicrobia bacterium GWA2_51_34]OGR63811.1 MAG: hypothetical protein A2X34_01905 [Elusimicrobia bacterium GWC2_51_8]OGR85476.1 MAG: hypothetical protein A2021_08070 [Elusimicrobia bacterium GWF2_52_66]HAF94959.1 endonuclease [Elusimicrobiota bacterium]HCE99131.1 endonuclease [Elusimicrobiota bacterium]